MGAGGNQMLRMTRAALLLLFALGTAQGQTHPNQTFGFPTVAAALDALRSKNGVVASNQDGWTVIEDRPAMTLWSFTPPGHEAHPAAVRRTIVRNGDDISVVTAVLCEAEKPACDALTAQFQQLTNKMREQLRGRRR